MDFLRHFVFDPPEVTDRALVYRVPASRIPPDAYPLKVSLELSYALSEDGLRVEFFFTNEEPELDAHVSFGLHPGFAVSSVRDCKVLFPEGLMCAILRREISSTAARRSSPSPEEKCPLTKRSFPIPTWLVCGQFPAATFVLEDSNLRPSHFVRFFRSSLSHALDRQRELYLHRAVLGIARQQSAQAV